MTSVPAGAAMPVELIPVDVDIALEVAAHEALIREAYKDSVGVWTWCVGMTSATGHNVERYIGKPQSLEHCMALYAWALTNYAARVRKAFAGMKLTRAQFAGALSFDWNTGGILKASWVKRFKAGDIEGAKLAFMSWKSPPEIIGRREEERDLFFEGRWVNDGTMLEYTRLTTRQTPNWKSGVRVSVAAELRQALAAPVEPELDSAPRPNAKPAAPTLSPAPAPRPREERPEDLAPSENTVHWVQERLRVLGYTEVGMVGTSFGPLTETAILAFRKDHGLPLTPTIDALLVDALLTAEPRELAPERAEAKPKEVREQVPEVAANWWTKIVAMLVTLGSAVTALINWLGASIGEVRELFKAAAQAAKPVLDLLGDVPPAFVFVIVAAAFGLVWYRSRKGELAGLAAFRSGERR